MYCLPIVSGSALGSRFVKQSIKMTAIARSRLARVSRMTDEEKGMARYNCRSCGFAGEAQWDGRLVCPHCNDTTKVGVAIAGWELAEVKFAVPEVTMPNVRLTAEHEVGGDRMIHLARDSACRVSTGIRNLADMLQKRSGLFMPIQQIGLAATAAPPEYAAFTLRSALQDRLRTRFGLGGLNQMRAARQHDRPLPPRR